MATKVFAQWSSHSRNEENDTHIDAIVDITVLGSDLGDLSGPSYSIEIPDLAVELLSTVEQAIRDAVKADVEGHGVTFGTFDTVFLR